MILTTICVSVLQSLEVDPLGKTIYSADLAEKEMVYFFSVSVIVTQWFICVYKLIQAFSKFCIMLIFMALCLPLSLVLVCFKCRFGGITHRMNSVANDLESGVPAEMNQ